MAKRPTGGPLPAEFLLVLILHAQTQARIKLVPRRNRIHLKEASFHIFTRSVFGRFLAHDGDEYFSSTLFVQKRRRVSHQFLQVITFCLFIGVGEVFAKFVKLNSQLSQKLWDLFSAKAAEKFNYGVPENQNRKC